MASIACGRCGIYHDEGLHLSTGERAKPVDWEQMNRLLDHMEYLERAWERAQLVDHSLWPDQHMIPLPPTEFDLPWWATPPPPSTRHFPTWRAVYNPRTGETMRFEVSFHTFHSTGNVGS
jgi:hypothetical protein